jgi:hypothetical protein
MKYEGYNAEGQLVGLTAEQAVEAVDRQRNLIKEFEKKRKTIDQTQGKNKVKRKVLPLFGYYGYGF